MQTPLLWEAWRDELRPHLDRRFVDFLLQGIQEGFRIGFDCRCRVQPARSLHLPLGITPKRFTVFQEIFVLQKFSDSSISTKIKNTEIILYDYLKHRINGIVFDNVVAQYLGVYQIPKAACPELYRLKQLRWRIEK